VRGGHPEKALGLVDQLDADSTAWARSAAARCRGLLEPEDADDHFTLAAGTAHTARSPFDVARAHLAHGEALRRQRRRVAAREQLRLAIATFDRLGARPWLERAWRELRATGESAAPRPAATAEELTPHELQVALLAADGQSNREIAAQLFVSPKTVEYHLAKVFRKLGVRSRFALAASLRRARASAGAGQPEPAADAAAR
jgi:DNA-binding NarL/FixJ family response regulator